MVRPEHGAVAGRVRSVRHGEVRLASALDDTLQELAAEGHDRLNDVIEANRPMTDHGVRVRPDARYPGYTLGGVVQHHPTAHEIRAMDTKPAGTGVLTPPDITTSLDLLMEEIEPGHALFSTTVSGESDESRLCGTMLELTLDATVHSALGDDRRRVVGLRIQRVRARDPLVGRVVAVGEVWRSGARFVTAHARVLDEGGRLRACGTMVVLVEDTDVVAA